MTLGKYLQLTLLPTAMVVFVYRAAYIAQKEGVTFIEMYNIELFVTFPCFYAIVSGWEASQLMSSRLTTCERVGRFIGHTIAWLLVFECWYFMMLLSIGVNEGSWIFFSGATPLSPFGVHAG